VITVIDDDESIRSSLQDLVQSLGFVVATFESAEDFLRSGCLATTACVVTDVRMPGMSGIELQARLIADGDKTPIVFVTSYPEEAIRARALKAGALGFLRKPFNDDSLIECLSRALGDRRAGSGPQS
jgi:FixJ family two-component response regulator